MKALSKEKDLAYIQQFKELSVTNVCRDLGIAHPNVLSGKASAKTIHKVREEIERRIKILKGI